MKTMKVTSSGQISLPADVRRRWHVTRVRLVDHGDHVRIEPINDDVLAATFGLFPGGGASTDQLRAEARREAAQREDNRAGVRRVSARRSSSR